MKILFVSFFSLFVSFFSENTSYTYSTKNGNVALFFDLTLGQMQASNNKTASTINVQSESVTFSMAISSFKFSNPILESQFKDVYMEVDKYPETTFSGKIREKVNFKSKKPQKVTVDGVLGMHGISQKRILPATVTIDGDKMKVFSEFFVKASDHKIDIPAGFFSSGKDEIKVTLDVTYTKD